VTIQSVLGGSIWIGWALLNTLLFDVELMHVLFTGLPYFVAYELGVLSRYLPGLRAVAKRLE
jgi:hypothetical protein